MSLYYSTYNEAVFRASVDEALKRVQSILDTTRHPRLAHEDDQHVRYDDKYSLAEFVINSGHAALLNVLQQLGLNTTTNSGSDSEKLAQVIKWVQEDKKTVTLRFQASDGCSLIKEQEVKIVSPHEYETETTTSTTFEVPHGGNTDASAASGSSIRNLLTGSNKTKTEKTTTRVTRTITESHWKVDVSYQITIFAGDASNSANLDQVVQLESRHTVATVVTAGGSNSRIDSFGPPFGGNGGGPRRPPPPIPEKTIHAPIDVNLTWLFSTLDGKDNTTNAAAAVPRFIIDRNDVKTCKTPRRNVQVQNAVDMYGELALWAMQVREFMVQRLARTIDASHQPSSNNGGSASSSTGDHKATSKNVQIEVGTRCKLAFNGMLVQVVEVLAENRFEVERVNQGTSDDQYGLPPKLTCSREDLIVYMEDNKAGQTTSTMTRPLWDLDRDLEQDHVARSIFVPILPIMENGSILSEDDANKLLNAHVRSMQQAVDKMREMYPSQKDATKIISSLEATLVLLSHHVSDICQTYHYSVDYIEEMLRNQLIRAIGKEVHPKDFDDYMRFHVHKKLLGARYAPKPFTYAIRQPNRYPDGILSIEDITPSYGRGKNNNKVEPVTSLVRHIPATRDENGDSSSSIFIPINAATSVEITGDRYIHGWMQYCFQSSACPMGEYQLAARARQFCSFLIIIGNMAGPDTFLPKEAIILQNKDEVLIPLITNVLPSAKEFKDAIASMSPQQQEFAKAFRSMQLETSVFGVCVVQIKPQLEKLLGLPNGALTKEIQLTQDLMSLFVEYQIPSDLLSFDDAAPDGSEMAMTAKLAAVKGHVKSVMDVLEAAKEKLLIEEERKADMRAEMSYESRGMDYSSIAASSVPFSAMGSSSSRAEKRSASGDSGVRISLSAARGRDNRAEKRSAHRPAEMIYGSIAPAAPPGMSAQAWSDPVHTADECYGTLNRGGIVMQTNQATNKVPQKQAATLENVGMQEGAVEDYTMIPKLLDAKLEAFDTDNSLRPTIIEAGTIWTRKRQENLLTSAETREVNKFVIQAETKKAFDLLDALSRSGTLPIDCAELHVMVGVTHCFENDVMGTVIQDNINPIHKVEKSLLMLASTIFREPAQALLHDDGGQLTQRLTASFPQLFLEPDQQG